MGVGFAFMWSSAFTSAKIALLYAPPLGMLAILGVAQLQVRRRRPDALWPALLFVTLDVIVFVTAPQAPSRSTPNSPPPTLPHPD